MDVPSIGISELRGEASEETSAKVRERVSAARRNREIGRNLSLTPAAERTLARASMTMSLSARGITRTLGVARTIACLAGSEETEAEHVAEALQFRVPATGAERKAEDRPPGLASVA